MSMLSQLLPSEQRWLRDTAVPVDQAPTVQEDLARRWDYRTDLADQGYSEERLSKHEAEHALQWAQFTPEQVRIALAIENVRGGTGLGMGVARRILRDDPAELAVGFALEARLEWLIRRLREQAGGGTEDNDLGLIPFALAARDGAMADRALDTPTPAGLQKDEVQHLLEQSWAAVVRRDLETLRPAAERLGKRKVDRSLKWLVQGFSGIARHDPELVAAALQQSLADAQRDRQRDEAQFPISIETHQFYRGAEWVSRDLVRGFDVTQGLPWDAGFHVWTQDQADPLSGWDLTPISPVLHQAVIQLCVPEWFRTLDSPESPWDTCRLILQDVGPNRRKVEEVVATWCRMRQWPAVDLGHCPVVVAPEVQRLGALLLRKTLLELGARAEFELVRPAAGEGG